MSKYLLYSSVPYIDLSVVFVHKISKSEEFHTVHIIIPAMVIVERAHGCVNINSGGGGGEEEEI